MQAAVAPIPMTVAALELRLELETETSGSYLEEVFWLGELLLDGNTAPLQSTWSRA